MKVDAAVARIVGIKTQCLLDYGFSVGPRDPRLNRNYQGKFMAVESYDESELPTDDGRNGPWCVVGDDLDAVVDAAFNYLVSCEV